MLKMAIPRITLKDRIFVIKRPLYEMCSLWIFTPCKLSWVYQFRPVFKQVLDSDYPWCLLTIKYDRASDILEVDWQCKHKSGNIPFTPLIVLLIEILLFVPRYNFQSYFFLSCCRATSKVGKMLMVSWREYRACTLGSRRRQ